MAEIEEELIFYTKADQVKFTTQTNGDILHITGFHLSQPQAATMAWLINADNEGELEFQIKVKA